MTEFVMVPREPTEAMHMAGYDIAERKLAPSWTAVNVWSAMIAASPQPVVGDREVVTSINAALTSLSEGFAEGGQMYSGGAAKLVAARKHLAKALASLASRPEGGWRPIETFSSDEEQHVLIAEADGSVLEARLLDDGRGWWARGNHPTDHWGEELFPTHWMPLPPPPSGEGG